MKIPRSAVFVLLILLIMALLFAFKPWTAFFSQPTQLAGVEVREYQGKLLSSVYDFRENSIKGPQHVNISSYTLQVTGLVNDPKSFSYTEVVDGHRHYRKVVTLNCVEGWSATVLWDGVLVRDLLDDAGIKSGAKTVIFYASDGYSTSLPLDYIVDHDILLGYQMNNVTLLPERGYPFELVAEDKWGYKWIRWVTKIELSDHDYEGYWESRGYSSTGDLNRSFLK